MKIINCTPHPIRFKASDGTITEFPYTGYVPRVSVDYTETTVDGILFSLPVHGDVVGLPEQEDGTYLIVSRMVASASGRSDLIVPCKFDRDESGNIMHCRSFEVMSV